MRLFFRIILLSIVFQNVQAQTPALENAETAFKNNSWKEAFSLYQNAGEGFLVQKNTGQFVYCNSRMSDCLIRENNFSEALNIAINNEKYIREHLPDKPLLLAKSLQAQGECYLNIGRNSEALERLKMAEELYSAAPNQELAECYNLLGIIYWNNQNRELALQYHEQALALRQSLMGDKSVPVADSYNNIGLVHVGHNDQLASDYFQKALDAYRNALGENDPKVGFALLNLAKVRAELGWYDEALAYQTKAEALWGALYGKTDHPAKAYSKGVRGQILQKRRLFEEALVEYNDALRQYKRLFGDKHPEVANAHFQIGSIWQEKSGFKTALDYFQQAIYANLPDQQHTNNYDLPRVDNYLNADYLLSALMAKAKILEALHFEKTLKPRDLKAAIATYQAADTLVSAIRFLRESEADKIRLGEVSHLIYENGIRLSLVLAEQPLFFSKYKETAFNFCERSKAALLLSAIQESQAKSFAGIPADILAQEDSLKKDIAYYRQLIAKGQADQVTRQNLFLAEREFRKLLEMLEVDYPSYFNLKHSTQLTSVGQLQAKLKANEMILSYFEASEQLYTFGITKRGVSVQSTDKPANWNKLIHGFRNSLYYRSTTDAERLAKEIHTLLFATKLPNSIERLIVIPSGQLFQIPFEALINPSTGNYLLTEYAINYAYAATLWANSAAGKAGNGLLAVAPIRFDGHPERLTTLEGAGKEASDLKNLFLIKGQNADQIRGEDATETTLKSTNLQQYRYIHLATHGEVNMVYPALSRIFLQAGKVDDGSLYTGELYSLKLGADLVTLSACETGLGQIAAGEGILGLSRALLYAGAANLLVSQWKVSDASTAQLMTTFYESLLAQKNQDNLPVALQTAKKTLLASKAYNDPYFWAPFILIGR